MIGFKHLKISLFAYRPTRKLAYFSYNYPAPLSTKNLPLRPLTKSLFFKLHGAIFALININPCLPVFIIKIRIIQAVMAAPAFFAQEGSFEFHLSGNSCISAARSMGKWWSLSSSIYASAAFNMDSFFMYKTKLGIMMPCKVCVTQAGP